MTRSVWNTREAMEASFEEAWRARLANAAHTHFGFDPALLEHEAHLGAHAAAVLVDDGDLRAAMVLRETPEGRDSGWPWRWHAVVEGVEDAHGMTAETAASLGAHAQAVVGGKRTRVFLPRAGGRASYRAGATFMQDLQRSEEALWKGMNDAKRRMCKRAGKRGYEIVEASDHSAFRAFATIQRTTRLRQGYGDEPEQIEGPPPGEAWREWELPWMWLLVAVKDGRVEAGSGFGFYPGGSVDYRTNASTDVARKDGANVLLGWEAMRLARARGFRWINWCGATRFKREFGGQLIDIHCQLGGGSLLAIPNLLTASMYRMRAGVAAWKRRQALRPAAQGGREKHTEGAQQPQPGAAQAS